MPMAPTAPAQAKSNAPKPRPAPFVRGAFAHSEPFYDATTSNLVGASSQPIGPIDIVSYGFARAILLDIICTSSGNAATVALQEDAPWAIFTEIAIQDVNSAPIYGPLDGYSAYLAHKYLGHRGQVDPKLSINYTAPSTGAGATAGTFRFQLRLNLEASGRDGLGSLPNMNASAAYKLRFTLGALSSIFSTAPNGTVTIRIRAYLEAWSQPNGTDSFGRPVELTPPASGTTQYISRQVTGSLPSGSNTIRLNRVGNLVRGLIFVFRLTTRALGETNMPPDLPFYVDSRLWFNYSSQLMRLLMLEQFAQGMRSTTFDAAGGPDNGVIVVPNMVAEFAGFAGYELRDQWLPTSQATRLELQPVLGAAGTVTIITNDVAPRGDVYVS